PVSVEIETELRELGRDFAIESLGIDPRDQAEVVLGDLVSFLDVRDVLAEPREDHPDAVVLECRPCPEGGSRLLARHETEDRPSSESEPRYVIPQPPIAGHPEEDPTHDGSGRQSEGSNRVRELATAHDHDLLSVVAVRNEHHRHAQFLVAPADGCARTAVPERETRGVAAHSKRLLRRTAKDKTRAPAAEDLLDLVVALEHDLGALARGLLGPDTNPVNGTAAHDRG